MGRRISAATAVVTVAAAALAVLLATVPALAHHKDEHLKGGGNGAAAAQPKNDGDNAHPSGKDRSTESGKSGNQGKSESDPDDDGRGPDRSNGGPDKPNGSGGVDKADQDGNNGCGNDDDFEDDNEGWCGRKPKPAKPAKPEVAPAGPCDADVTMPGTQPCKDDGELDTGVLPAVPCPDESVMPADHEACETDEDALGGVISRPAVPGVEISSVPEEAEVLGERLAQSQPDEGAPAQRAASFLGQPLPFTGSAVESLAAIAVGLVLAGAGLLMTLKRT